MTCTVQVDGSPSDCTVISVDGASAFADAALLLVRKLHYTPAWQHGHVVPEPHHMVSIVFTPPPDPFPDIPKPPKDVVFSKPTFSARLPYPSAAMDRNLEGDVLVLCDVGMDGGNHNCSVAGIHGDPSFGPAALAYVMSETIHATRNGLPVAVAQHATLITFHADRSKW
jgi:outer membrane biosynthesis protein TonB